MVPARVPHKFWPIPFTINLIPTQDTVRIMKEFDDQVVDNALEQMQKDFDNHIRDLKDDDDQTMAENLYEWFSEKYVSTLEF